MISQPVRPLDTDPVTSTELAAIRHRSLGDLWHEEVQIRAALARPRAGRTALIARLTAIEAVLLGGAR